MEFDVNKFLIVTKKTIDNEMDELLGNTKKAIERMPLDELEHIYRFLDMEYQFITDYRCRLHLTDSVESINDFKKLKRARKIIRNKIDAIQLEKELARAKMKAKNKTLSQPQNECPPQP